MAAITKAAPTTSKEWKLVWYTTKSTLSEARLLENKLKNITSRARIQSFIEKYTGGGPDEA